MDFAELFSNPSMMHAAVVHMPIAAVVFGLMFIVVSAIFHRNNTVRAITALMFFIASAASYVAIETGEDARGEVPNTISRAVSQTITDHADCAEKVMYAAIFTLVCLLISLIRVDSVRIIALILGAVGAIVANVFAAQTGHLGGTLVYNEGIGTPMMKQGTSPPVVVTPAEPVPLPVPVPVPGVPDGPSEDASVDAPEMTDTPVVAVPEPEPEPEPEVDDPELVPISEFTMEEAKQVSYVRDIWPVFDDLCVYCHEDPGADGDFVMTTIEDMIRGGKKGGPGIVPGKPDESSIVMYIRGIANPRMPEDEDPLPAETLHLIRMWIAAGAIDDTNGPAPEEAAPAPAEAEPALEAPGLPAPAEDPTADDMTEDTPADARVEAPAPATGSEESAPAEESEVTGVPVAEGGATDEMNESTAADEATEASTSDAPEDSATDEAAGDVPAEDASESSATEGETTETDEPASAPESESAPTSDTATEETEAPVEPSSDSEAAEGSDASEEGEEAVAESTPEGPSV